MRAPKPSTKPRLLPNGIAWGAPTAFTDGGAEADRKVPFFHFQLETGDLKAMLGQRAAMNTMPAVKPSAHGVDVPDHASCSPFQVFSRSVTNPFGVLNARC